MNKAECIKVLVGKKIIKAIDMDKEPKAGMTLNLLDEPGPEREYNGNYRIRSVKITDVGWNDYFHIEVERIGDIDKEQPTHAVDIVNYRSS